MSDTQWTSPWRARRLGAVLAVGIACGACGDLADPVLLSCDVEVNEQAVQSIEIDITGQNVFNDDVDPNARFILEYDEPVDLTSVRGAVSIEDSENNTVPTTITQRLFDVIVDPDTAMSNENHTLKVNSGIDDESKNTTDYYVNITFYVE